MKVEDFIDELEVFVRDRVGPAFYFEYDTDDNGSTATLHFKTFSVEMLDTEKEESEEENE